MIRDIYNRKSAQYVTDNGVVQQGVETSNRAIYYAPLTANSNHAPAPASTSVSKMFDRDRDYSNPIVNEALSDGLGALFGAATGLDGLEMFIDYACDAVEFYDDFVQDRFGNTIQMPIPQPDPRLWGQPMPGMSMAA